MKITQTLKETLSHQGKFLTLSLTLSMLEKCIHLLLHYGISKESLSPILCGYYRISEELKIGYQYIKEKEDFNNIIKDNHLGETI